VNWIHDTVAEFGRQLGLPGLAIGPQGVAQLSLASGGLLAVEPVRRLDEDEVLVYLGRPAGHRLSVWLHTALARAHLDQAGPIGLQVLTRGSGEEALLLVLARLPARTFTPQALVQTVDHLARWLDEIEAGRSR